MGWEFMWRIGVAGADVIGTAASRGVDRKQRGVKSGLALSRLGVPCLYGDEAC